MPPMVQRRNAVMQVGCANAMLLEHDECCCETMVGAAAREGFAVSQASGGVQMLRAGEAVLPVW